MPIRIMKMVNMLKKRSPRRVMGRFVGGKGVVKASSPNGLARALSAAHGGSVVVLESYAHKAIRGGKLRKGQDSDGNSIYGPRRVVEKLDRKRERENSAASQAALEGVMA